MASYLLLHFILNLMLLSGDSMDLESGSLAFSEKENLSHFSTTQSVEESVKANENVRANDDKQGVELQQQHDHHNQRQQQQHHHHHKQQQEQQQHHRNQQQQLEQSLHHRDRQHRHLRYHRVSEVREKETGLWQVIDVEAKHRHPDPLTHHRHPSFYDHFSKDHNPACIFANIQMSIVIPLTEGNGNRTVVVPSSAEASGTCGKIQQSLTLTWNNTDTSEHLVKKGSITLLFKKNGKFVTLSDIWANLDLFLEEEDEKSYDGKARADPVESQDVILSAKDLELFPTPLRFCYQCRDRFVVEMNAVTMPIQSKIGEGDVMIVEPIRDERVYLVFDYLKVETFRFNAYDNTFTHLKWDCKYHWTYKYVPLCVGGALICFIVVMILAFCFREKLGFKVIRPEATQENNYGTLKNET